MTQSAGGHDNTEPGTIGSDEEKIGKSRAAMIISKPQPLFYLFAKRMEP